MAVESRELNQSLPKAWILSEGAVLPTEDRAQFDELLQNLREDLKPQGTLEELLVEKIAVSFWRLRRLLRYDFENNQKGAPLVAAGGTCLDLETCIKKLADVRKFLAKDGPTSPEQVMKFLALDSVGEALQNWAGTTKTEVEFSGLADTKSRDTLLRYETTIERQLYRAIDQLERLQRQRAGDYVLPPVKVGISTDV